jgi:hypothetical protein
MLSDPNVQKGIQIMQDIEARRAQSPSTTQSTTPTTHTQD